MFVNNVLMHALLARGLDNMLPRLTGARVGVALAAALVLIPSFGANGAAAGFTLSELVLLALAARACAREGFAVPVLRGVSQAALLSVPMALVIGTLAGRVLIAIPIGALTYGATLLLAWRLLPRRFLAPALVSSGQP
jgi:hypothetical protein